MFFQALALLATYGRIIMIVWEILFVAAVVIERAAATLWIGFYESMQFTELSTLLILLKLTISIVAITIITQCRKIHIFRSFSQQLKKRIQI